MPVDVLEADGNRVAVSGNGLVSAQPARVVTGDGGRRSVREITEWVGPWPCDERWWDPATHRRRARLQVLDDHGSAYLLAVEGGRWWIEATYD